MCGRFALGIPHSQIAELHGYNVQVGEWVDQEHFHPRYNVAPRSYAPVIRRDTRGAASKAATNEHQSSEESGNVIMHTMKWGLVPHWSKHDDNNLNTINARCEALIEGVGMWNSIKGKKRCAVPSQGYYEWLKKGKERLPYFTKRGDGDLMLLAGMYDCVTLEGQSEPLWTFTIVTTNANKDFEWLHDRQPVILPTTDALNIWLDTSSGTWNSSLSKIVQPYNAQDVPLECYQVPKEVGKVGNESPTFIEPLSQRRDGIQAMFEKQIGAKASSQSSQKSPTKRKKDRTTASRSTSPTSPHKKARREVKEVIDLTGSPPSSKREQTSPEKISTCEDDSEIEHIDHPEGKSNTKKASSEAHKKASKKKPSPKKSASASHASASTTKITGFFRKA